MIDQRDLAEAYDAVEKKFPELWRICYPRFYEEPTKCGVYYSPKMPARQFMAVALKWGQGLIAESEQYEFLCASNLARFEMPMFWIGNDMAQAVRQTTPPGELDWYTMPMPFEACSFVLPKGSLVHPLEGDVVFITYSRLRAGEYHTSPFTKRPFGSVNGGMTFFAFTAAGNLIHWNMPLDAYGSRMTIPDMDRLMLQYRDHVHSTGFWVTKPPEMTPEDDLLGIEVAHMVFGAILLMTERPDLVTRGALKKKIPASKGKAAKEFWSPNIFGEFYRIRREAAGVTGAHTSPRFHWVRGFYKEQAHGEGRTQRKRIWIEPYTRGIAEA